MFQTSAVVCSLPYNRVLKCEQKNRGETHPTAAAAGELEKAKEKEEGSSPVILFARE